MADVADVTRHGRWRAQYHAVRKHWTVFQRVIDVGIWLVAVPTAVLLRYDFRWELVDLRASGAMAALGALCFVVVGSMGGLNRRRFRYASFDEVSMLGGATLATTLVLLGVDLAWSPRPIPASAPVIAGLLALLGVAGCRYTARRLLEGLSRPAPWATPVLVYGAGDAGSQLVASMQRNPASRYRPVGLVDDHPSKAKLTICGVRVLGSGAELAAIAAATGVELVVLAIPSADGPTIRSLVERAGAAGLRVHTLPALGELTQPEVDTSDVRPITEADLLGRRQIDTDVAAIADYIRDKRVLVTGAGGSIGSELCRQLHRFGPAQLVMLDRDESALHAVQLSIEGRALLDSPNLVVADIRDDDRLFEVFDRHRPQVVFHAAALKHLPLLEMHPNEGVKTNIWGTQHVLAAAEAFGVERLINISTDKAANPTSVLGYTKRIAEQLTASMAEQTERPYLSVRFGNVLNSRGSVVPAFQAMIEAGGPVTVTHPEVTRYFMTVPEAVQLVIQAGAIGSGGEVLILDMGQPVRIADIARRLIEASGRRVDIVYTGLRPGEKLHEDLVSLDELGVRHSHPLITHASVPPMRPSAVAANLRWPSGPGRGNIHPISANSQREGAPTVDRLERRSA